MNKRKIALLAMSACMIAILAIGGTLAYFTDTENDINVFALGNLDITLNEDQRENETSNKLVDFEDGSTLLPIVGSAQGEKETVDSKTPYGVENDWSVPSEAAAQNWIDKIVSVTNEKGSEDAYVRVLFAFPAKLDAKTAATMMMHWNHDGNMPAGQWKQMGTAYTYTDADQEVYNVYNYTYLPKLAGGKTTEWPAITGVYMDKNVDATVENDVITYTHTVTGQTAQYKVGAKPKLYVIAQAVQAEGFVADEAKKLSAAEVALEAGFPLTQENCTAWFNAATDKE